MLRKFIFHSSADGQEIILPVTPSSYQVETGQGIQVVNLTQFGDYALAGYPSIYAFTLDCMFPAQSYPFMVGGSTPDPDLYIEFFERAVKERQVLRFVVSDTLVSNEVLVESMRYGEQDGTNDVYVTLSLMPYRRLQVASAPSNTPTPASPKGAARTGDAPSVTQQSYTIKRGDTLWGICRRFYGEGKLAYPLAKFNQIKNADLIYDGDTIKIPEKSLLTEKRK
ncbi:MAG: LysM peptidoglycan-binding domain-containing protein [Butyricicoccus pullicaecorum]|nr:LysM peptidoglycan-binding domain-containing protein [Butyricicoccus pullicaecorum]